jgi:hypothetical protein
MKLTGSAYLVWCLFPCLILVTGIGAFNYWADPAGIYHYGKSWDWIKSRPEILDMELIHKAQAIKSAQADVLILGSSRSAEGLDPLGPDVPPHAYNLAIPQGGLYEAWRYLQHACAVHTPQTVVLGVEYAGFWPDRPMALSFSDSRLLVTPDGRPTPALVCDFADLTSTLYSFSAARLSWNTLKAPKDSNMKFEAGYEANAPLVINRFDLASNVLQATKYWVSYLRPGPFRDAAGEAPQMNSYRRIIALCAEKHIRLIVLTHPVNAVLLDKFTEDWNSYRDWMKTLATALAAQPEAKAELWDFTGYNSISTEPLPAPTDKYSHMHYYWEGSHYRKVVGDMVLRKVFTGKGPAAFGQRVDTANVDQDLQRLRAEKQAWHEHGQAVPIDSGAPEAGPTPGSGGT